MGEVHDVEDDVVECTTEVEEKCEDETSGYTTNTKCSKWPREVCSVSKKPVKKYTPITGCTKEPRELCAPAGCGFKQGAEECYDKVHTVVQDAPKEQCTLEPQRTCKHVTKLVPKLEPTEECVDVPKRSAPGQGPTQGRSRSPLSRSGATFLPRSPALAMDMIKMHNNWSRNIGIKDSGTTTKLALIFQLQQKLRQN